MMDFSKFTDRSRKVMQLANMEALRLNHEWIGLEHVLLGLVKEGSGVGAAVLVSCGADLPAIRQVVEKLCPPGPSMVTMGKLPRTPACEKMLSLAASEAERLNHHYIGTEHLLLGTVKVEVSIITEILPALNITKEQIVAEVENLVGKSNELRHKGAVRPNQHNDLVDFLIGKVKRLEGENAELINMVLSLRKENQ